MVIRSYEGRLDSRKATPSQLQHQSSINPNLRCSNSKDFDPLRASKGLQSQRREHIEDCDDGQSCKQRRRFH
jgi:hypothetical protein